MSDTETRLISGKKLLCKHCNNDLFYHRRTLLDTAFSSFLDLEWLNPSAEVFVCSECGHLEYFLSPKVGPDDEEVQCFACGKVMPTNVDKCASCGWTYKE
ncbi:MAG: hypothetical protein GY758_17315 [Fuerstiella sp.]|nr:hypothetical protein [Fuerstiella sp.]